MHSLHRPPSGSRAGKGSVILARDRSRPARTLPVPPGFDAHSDLTRPWLRHAFVPGSRALCLGAFSPVRELPSGAAALAVADPEHGSGGLHTPTFRGDDEAIPVGIRAMSHLVVGYLTGQVEPGS